MYDLEIYVLGVVIEYHKGMDYKEARRRFIDANKSWDQYPQLYIDGRPVSTMNALRHFRLPGARPSRKEGLE